MCGQPLYPALRLRHWIFIYATEALPSQRREELLLEMLLVARRGFLNKGVTLLGERDKNCGPVSSGEGSTQSIELACQTSITNVDTLISLSLHQNTVCLSSQNFIFSQHYISRPCYHKPSSHKSGPLSVPPQPHHTFAPILPPQSCGALYSATEAPYFMLL